MTQAYPYNWYTPGEDPEDADLGIGVFRYPDGSSRYGQDLEGANAMKKAGQYGPPPGTVAPPGVQDPNEYGPPPPPVRREPVESKSGDLRRDLEKPGGVDIPQSSRLAYVNNNPGNLRFAGQEGARQGEGGFAAFDSPEAGAAALYRQIDLDAGRGLTLGQFVQKYAPESENDTATYTKQMTEFTGASADTPISQIDRDKLAAAIAKKESSSTLGGTAPPQLTPQATGAIDIPGAPRGLIPSEVQQQGIPLTPQQMQARESQIQTQAQGEREARGEALLNQRQALQNVQEQQFQVAQQREAQAKADQQREELVQKQANDKIEAELTRPIQQVDPKRYIKSMSTGQQVFGVLGLLTSALGQTFLQHNGQNAPNMAMQWLDKSIDQDIQAQLEEIRQGEVSSRNRVAHWTRVFDNAEAGKTAAKLEAEQAVNARLKAQLLDVDDANLQATAVAVDQEIQKRSIDAVNALRENEANKLRMKYEAPKPVPARVGPIAMGANSPLRKDPAYRAQVAAHFDETKNGDDLRKFSAGMDKINTLRGTLSELENLYKVQPDAQGAYPADDSTFFSGGRYQSGTTGLDPSDKMRAAASPERLQRERRLDKAWEAVRIAARAEWKTEPNGEKIQTRFQELNVPSADADVPLAMAKLRDTLEKSQLDLEAGALPQVVAYYLSQAGPNVPASRVSGRVP